MNLFTIPLRNLGRRPLRTVLLTAVFTIGVMSVVSIQQLSTVVGNNLEEKLNKFGANILVTPKTESLSVSYGGLDLGNVAYGAHELQGDPVLSSIRAIDLKDRLSAVAPKFASISKVNGVPVAVVGVSMADELSIKTHWYPEGNFPQNDREVLLGSNAAEKIGIRTGQNVSIEGNTLKVAGILDPTGTEDDNVIFMDINLLRNSVGRPGAVHFIEVAALCAGCPIDEIVEQIVKAVPDTEVKALQHVVKQRMSAIGFVNRMAWSVSGVILLTACFMIGLSIFSAVNERKTEIGLMRSLGFSTSSVFSIFCLEALFIGSMAGIAGYAGGFLASGRILQTLDLGEADIAFDPAAFGITFLAVAGLSVLAAVIPSLRATRVDPSRTLVSL
ncbi:ABC transporter permease [Maridesulfovibrio sp. FT414]|uniref:ABC transporter permease n=1 Tax=Maridesulfovibrio sp. FT414 TaxID=2979469 RepID=UPI003D808FA6